MFSCVLKGHLKDFCATTCLFFIAESTDVKSRSASMYLQERARTGLPVWARRRSKPDAVTAINMEIVWLSGNAGCSSDWTGEWKREHKNKNLGWHTREKQDAGFRRCLFEFGDSNLLHPEGIAVTLILSFFLYSFFNLSLFFSLSPPAFMRPWSLVTQIAGPSLGS